MTTTADASPSRLQVRSFLDDLWIELLPTEDGGDFFERGGDSVLAVVVMARLSRFIGVKVSVGEIFFHPTLDELADVAYGHLAAKTGRV